MDRSKTLVAATAAFALGCSAAGAALAADRITIQTHFNPTLSVIGEASKNFTDNLEGLAGEDLRIRFYEAGKLVPTLETFDAVKNGTLDAVWGWPGYFMGKIPALTLFAAVPFGPDADETVAWMMQGDGGKLAQEIMAKHGVHGIFCGVIGPEASGWFKKEIKTLDDLKGLKVRYAGLGGEVLSKLGASVTVLAAGEIFPNLEKGVIDATEFSMPSVDKALGFYKIAQHYYFPGWHQPGSTAFFMVNQAKWDSLSEANKTRIKVACDANVAWELSRGIGEQAEAMAYYREQGTNIHTWPAEIIEAFREKTAEVMSEQSAADADFKRVYENQQAYLKQVRAWSGPAAMPQN